MTLPRFALLQKYHPIRNVDWRWQRAQHLVENGLRFLPRRDDEATLRAAKYLRALPRVGTDRQAMKVLQEFHDIHAAELLATRNGQVKLEVEARLLARSSSEEIAAKCAIETSTVSAFESLFFQVSDRLDATDYIRGVIGLDISSGLARNIQSIIKSFAYFGGSGMLDLMLAALNEKRLGPIPPQHTSTEYSPELLRRARHAMAAMLLPENPGWGIKIHKLTRQITANSANISAETARIDVDLDRMLAFFSRNGQTDGLEGATYSGDFEQETRKLA